MVKSTIFFLTCLYLPRLSTKQGNLAASPSAILKVCGFDLKFGSLKVREVLWCIVL